ncbi:MAG: hypothetical protein QOG03_2127 [Actinomycetota bacterium]|jgi:LysM repeat protein|nr:hypothetical protein [Actinomycetota bacterium]
MAAIAYPNRQHTTARPALRLVAGGRARQPMRFVYWRRRVAALVLAAGLVLGLRAAPAWLRSGPLSAPGSPAPATQPIGATTYVVQAGDTVWAIARRVQPSGDIRPLVDRLQAQLRGAVLVPGTRLHLD